MYNHRAFRLRKQGMTEEEPRGAASCEGSDRHYMYWWMHGRCDFRCAYCFRRSDDTDVAASEAECRPQTAENIVRRFDETGKLWHVYMTGGEPFLYPDFVAIAEGLTRRHSISFSTNLSRAEVERFADRMDHRQVVSVDVSLHIQEREKLGDGVSELIRKLRYLQDRDFPVRLLYVAYPPVLGRMRKDFERLRAEGIARIEAKVFQGSYEGRRYPRDYSEDERALLEELGLNRYEREILASRVCFLGRKCIAGHRAFVMDPSGQVTRCHSVANEHGNLFEGTFRPDETARRCPVRRCSCTYQGMKFAEGPARAVPRRGVAQAVRLLIRTGDLLAGR